MLILNDFNTSVQKALGEIDPKYMNYHGLVICGSHTPINEEMLIDSIRQARIDGTPTLLICFGYQLGAIEYARNILGITDATSEEFGLRGTFVVKKRPKMKVGLHEGETWWSNYDVDPSINWVRPDYFFAAPFHPEYQSSKDKPHPLLVDFLNYCKTC